MGWDCMNLPLRVWLYEKRRIWDGNCANRELNVVGKFSYGGQVRDVGVPIFVMSLQKIVLLLLLISFTSAACYLMLIIRPPVFF